MITLEILQIIVGKHPDETTATSLNYSKNTGTGQKQCSVRLK